MNAKAVKILAKKGITTATQHHDYQYLYKAVLQAMEEYHQAKSKEEAEERYEKALSVLSCDVAGIKVRLNTIEKEALKVAAFGKEEKK